MESRRIADYALLSDCCGSALVARGGTVEWWCAPRFDSPSVFGRMLGRDAGYWSLAPVEPAVETRAYVGDSLVLRTRWTTVAGVADVTDLLVLGDRGDEHTLGKRSPHVLLRTITGVRGAVTFAGRLEPRMEYGLTVPVVTSTDTGAELAAGAVLLTLDTNGETMVDEFAVVTGGTVTTGARLTFALQYSSRHEEVTGPRADPEAVERTLAQWQSWNDEHTSYSGPYAQQVRRSTTVLQGLTYGPSGAVVAAATTSLPEQLGADLNWDYRFVWLRDLTLTLRAQWVAACPDETGRFFAWLDASMGQLAGKPLQIAYGVEGERDLTEHALDHLPGFAASAPVRVGNDAWRQRQLDVLGEVLDAAHLLRDTLDFDDRLVGLLSALADQAADTWQRADAGMWEARDEERHYLSSKVMCWVALDRAILLRGQLGDDSIAGWTSTRDDIKATVLERGWNADAGAYTGAFGSDRLDASVLLLPLVGFLPADDERMLRTIRAIEAELGKDRLVRRWAGDTAGFLICTFWMSECLALAGDLDGATAWFERALATANDLGLLAEEVDPATGDMLGNFPQAFSHVGLINAAWRLGQQRAHANDERRAP